MSNKLGKNTKKESLCLKIKNLRGDKTKRKELKYSYLNDFNRINKEVGNEIIILESNKQKNYIYILKLNHPILNDIYVYSNQEWKLYYNYGIIEECLKDNILLVKYDLIENNQSEVLKKIHQTKNKITKYLMHKIPLKLYSKIFLKFLKENKEITKIFRNFFIIELLNEKPENFKAKSKTENTDDIDIDMNNNLNINSLIFENNQQNEDTEQSSGEINDKLIKKKLFPQLDKNYVINRNEFLKILEEQLNYFSEKQNNLNKIKEIIGEQNETTIKFNNDNKYLKTSLVINTDDNNINDFSLINEQNFDNNQTCNVLLTELIPPCNYVKKLLNDDNFFKKIDKEEYYIGIEQFKDNMNKKFLKYNFV